MPVRIMGLPNRVINAVTRFIILLSGFMLATNACLLDNDDFLKIINLYEEAPIGTEVGRLTFKYPSLEKRISIKKPNNYFDYNITLNIFVVKARIDTDSSMQPVQTMVLECTPLNGPPLEIEVEFDIEHLNEYAPEFRPSNVFNFSVSEIASEGTQVGIIEAVDKDRGNAFVRYELIMLNDTIPFKLTDLPAGRASLLLTQSLNFEAKSVYQFEVLAKDCQQSSGCEAGQKTSKATVTVNVLDADDLSPEFDRPDYRVSIFDDSVKDTMVVQVFAKDQDALNAPIRYSLSGDGSQYFFIHPNTGMITVSDVTGLVKERTYLLQVKATQVNDESKRSTAVLVIKIIATNANSPKFLERSYKVTLAETSPLNTTVALLSANYLVSSVQLNFTISNSSMQSPFRLKITGWNTAEVVLNSTLDYQKIREYNYAIQVSDGQYTDTAQLLITILPANRVGLKFEKPSYEFKINWASGALVGSVKASNTDGSQKIMYKVLQPYDSLFLIDADGRINLLAEATSYQTGIYRVNVMAWDSKDPSVTAIVAVAVELQNIPGPLSTTHVLANTQNQTEKEDRLVIYIISGIACFLLVMVSILLLCFFIRRKNERNQNKKDKAAEEALHSDSCTTDTLKSSVESQNSYNQTVLILKTDAPAETVSQISETLSKDYSDGVKENEYYSQVQEPLTQMYSKINSKSFNNLSTQISYTEYEFHELSPQSPSSDDNNASQLTLPKVVNFPSNTDSGRSSFKEERSPFTRRQPFQSFQTIKQVEENFADDAQYCELESSTRLMRPQKTLQTTSFIANIHNPESSSFRHVDNLTMRSTESLASTFIAEAPEGFRTNNMSRINSPISTTSDYGSNTPTPEIHLSSIITNNVKPTDHDDSTLQSSSYDYYKSVNSRAQSEKLPRKHRESRSLSPESDSGHGTDDTSDRANNFKRPEMTIYF